MKIIDGRELMGRNEYQEHRGLKSAYAVTKAEKSGRLPGAVIRTVDGDFVGIDWKLADELWVRNTDPTEAAKSGKVYPTASSSTRASTPLIDQAPAASLLGNEGQGAGALPLPGSAVSPPALSGAHVCTGPEHASNTSLLGPRDPAQAALPSAAGSAGELALAGDGDATAGPLTSASSQEGAGQPLPGSADAGFQEHRTKRERFLAAQAELDYLAKIGALVAVADVEREQEECAAQVMGNVFRIVPKMSAILAAETDPARIERLLNDALRQAFNECSRVLADGVAGGLEERAPALS